MNKSAYSRIICSWLGVVVILACFGLFSFVSIPQGYAEEQSHTSRAKQDADDSDDWIFDHAPYTNNPKSGDRVWQYKPEKTAYRDPYSVFDSPHVSFPFEPDSADSFFYGFPYYSSGMWPYFGPYIPGTNTSGLFPYDGDPND